MQTELYVDTANISCVRIRFPVDGHAITHIFVIVIYDAKGSGVVVIPFFFSFFLLFLWFSLSCLLVSSIVWKKKSDASIFLVWVCV